ncbi:hypothetical protein AURDEDRAFT_114475 [Auricularia subglabra TFB-10046 SS5]|nr:hypothetical protein AURDEDRAFT_114475 [Auricularia subglabra TFB-10046 SS5]
MRATRAVLPARLLILSPRAPSTSSQWPFRSQASTSGACLAQAGSGKLARNKIAQLQALHLLMLMVGS